MQPINLAMVSNDLEDIHMSCRVLSYLYAAVNILHHDQMLVGHTWRSPTSDAAEMLRDFP